MNNKKTPAPGIILSIGVFYSFLEVNGSYDEPYWPSIKSWQCLLRSPYKFIFQYPDLSDPTLSRAPFSFSFFIRPKTAFLPMFNRLEIS